MKRMNGSLLRLCLPALALLASTGGLAAQHSQQTVDVAEQWVFISLGTESPVVQVTDAANSLAWDLAILGTEVMVNGGSTGPAGVTVYCVCQNRAATADEVMMMTADSEIAGFEAVSAASIPSDPAAWHPATFGASPWYRYNLRNDHLIWPTYEVYLVKRGEQVYKLQLTGYYGRGGEPRQVTFRWAPLRG
jgi:hypothetical protein